jgi:hypothetical protein
MILISGVLRVALLALAVVLFSSGCATQSAGARRSNSRLDRQMIGSWVQVGRPGDIGEAPARGGRFKYRTGTHWIVFSVEPSSGLVTENFGGTYTMNENEYVETQTFADAKWLGDNGKSFTFLVRIDGELMTQTGVGNPFNEVWKRVKAGPAEPKRLKPAPR